MSIDTTLSLPASSVLSVHRCPEAYPYFCHTTFSCVQSSAECISPPICPTSAPVLCSTGYCVATKNLCSHISDYICPLGYHLCEYSKTCVEKPRHCPTIVKCPQNEMRCGNNGCHSLLPSNYLDSSVFPSKISPLESYNENYLDFQYFHSSSDDTFSQSVEECVTSYLDIYVNTCNVYTSATLKESCIRKLRSRYELICVRTHLFLPCSRYDLEVHDETYYLYDIYPSFAPSGDTVATAYSSIALNDTRFDPSLFLLSVHKDIRNTAPEPLCPLSHVRCSDGSCVKKLDECPSLRLCPRDRPVLCADGTCQYNSDHCISNIHCQSGYKLCPDGTCTFITRKCPAIFCPSERPYVCWDHSCRVSRMDCPVEPQKIYAQCKDYNCIYHPPLQYPNDNTQFCSIYGQYQKDRSLCLSSYLTNGIFYYVSLSMFIIDAQISSRAIQTSFCGYGKHLCPNGICVQDPSNCALPLCPILSPYRCNDGTCVKNESQCPKSACESTHFYAYCNNSWRCIAKVENQSDFVTYASVCRNLCSSHMITCFDGSCATSYENCPLGNGCPQTKPIKCHNGACVSSYDECGGILQ